MQYGEKYEFEMVNSFTNEPIGTSTFTYKRAEWNGWHTDDIGDGLWFGHKQVLGTCDFSVAGCATEKAAKAKIRKHVKENNEYYWAKFFITAAHENHMDDILPQYCDGS